VFICLIESCHRAFLQGTSESFVFTNVTGHPYIFRPTGLNRYFVLCTTEALAFGGGGHFALHIDAEL
jgi:hypothetical protein